MSDLDIGHLNQALSAQNTQVTEYGDLQSVLSRSNAQEKIEVMKAWKAHMQTLGGGLAQGLGGGGLIGQGHANQGYAQATSSIRAHYSPLHKLAVRLGLDEQHGLRSFCDEIVAYENDKWDEAIVFIIKDGKPIVLKDDRGLFPSDRLIAQINLLRG